MNVCVKVSDWTPPRARRNLYGMSETGNGAGACSRSTTTRILCLEFTVSVLSHVVWCPSGGPPAESWQQGDKEQKRERKSTRQAARADGWAMRMRTWELV
jgi:hypothetical protein